MAGGISPSGIFPSGIFPSGIFPSGIFPHITENVTLIYPIISYNEDNEMFQILGTSKAHPVQVRSLTTGELVVSLTTPTFTVYVNGTLSAETVTISAFNSTMLRYLVTVPAALAANPYDSVEINISDSVDGEGFAMINIVPPPSTIATAVWSGTEGAAVHTATTSTLTLAAINAEVDTAISDFDTATPIAKTSELSGLAVDLSTVTGGGTATLASLETDIEGISTSGSESIITGYTLNASAKTIDTGNTALTIEQVISIYNLSTGSEIYSCLNPRKRRMFLAAPDNIGIDISVAAGVISYIEDSGMTDDDKLMIVANL